MHMIKPLGLSPKPRLARSAHAKELPTKRFTSPDDSAGKPLWSEHPLLAKSLYRFIGQSAPAAVLCEVDLESLTERDKRKLFVGLTRAQMRVDVVLSERAARALADCL